jgi:putative transposase
MSDLMLLSEAQMRRIKPYFPLSHGLPRVDDRLILSGIIFVLRNGMRWRDAPREYGPHKTIYNRFIRWSRLGVFNRILAELTAKRGKPDQLMIDATHLKSHRTAASLLKRGCSQTYRTNQMRPELQAARCLRWSRSAFDPAFERGSDERLQRCRTDDRSLSKGQDLAGGQGLRRRLVSRCPGGAQNHRLYFLREQTARS